MIPVSSEKTVLPSGFQAIPLRNEDSNAPIAVCLLFRSSQAPNLILLRESFTTSIYLGCLADRSGDVKAWLEIWVQESERLSRSFRVYFNSLSNVVLDRRWRDRVQTFRLLNHNDLIETGWENENPLPAFIETKNGEIVHPRVSGSNLVLCRDDSALIAAGLPPYTATLHRYVWTGSSGNTFWAISKGAPQPAGVGHIGEITPDLVPFNPGAGLFMVRVLSPLNLTGFADLLGGKSWTGPAGWTGNFGGPYALLHDPTALIEGGAHLFAGRAGKTGRLMEILHLKINLVYQLLAQLRGAIQDQQLPFLQLNSESFQVALSETGAGLPFFWTARVRLVESICSVPIQIKTSEARYFVPAEDQASSIYRPQLFSVPATGHANLRIRKVLPPVSDGVVLEATLVSDEPLHIAANDLIHLELVLPEERIDLYGRLDASQALAAGETRLRTLPQRFSETTRAALIKVAGASVTHATFEVLPLLSSPFDMYSAAVLAIRILMVDDENTLALALDEVLSLARQISAEYDSNLLFSERIQRIVQRDQRWVESLGPQRIARAPALREIASRIIPPELWWETIGFVTCLFPGIGPDSFARDLGDAPPWALHRVFDDALAQLELLQLRSRSLIVSDWLQNAEMQEVIADLA
ncbi:MAG: hypothetical protein JOY96_12815 [Verrucomicrobia bacterium]|nr:hypothetical protein [Verrucomicrobiota bacterium]